MAVAAAVDTTSGPVLFARYAYPPNRLGLCGPDDAPALIQGAEAGAERELRQLAAGFDGAFPYLRLIAEANGIADPLDRRVVEGYWLGNALTAAVRPRALHHNVDERFRARMGRPEWRWLERALDGGSRPNHAFHVLEIFPRVGLLRGGETHGVVETMDACRVRWGRVLEVDGGRLLVATPRLELSDGRLRLGDPRVESVSAWLGPRGPLDGVAAGDDVSLHWGWASERLSRDQRVRLERWTRAAVRIANMTV